MRRALVTGSAGFIGYHLCEHLLAAGWQVTGLDALTPYYDVTLKKDRHARLTRHAGFTPVIADICDMAALSSATEAARPEVIVHLAAQAGVRYSLEAPRTYLDTNVTGSFNVIEAARAAGVAHLMMASTSSAYGANTEMPYAETHRAVHPMSLYAATKIAGEAIAHSQSHLHGLPITQFRFFTVYGPWGRPDMALFKFVRAMLAGEPIEIYNHGRMKRDFTYVTDLVAAIARLIDAVPGAEPVAGDSLSPVAPYRVVNIGNADPVPLMDFVTEIERALGMEAQKTMLPMQPGDVPATFADTALLRALIGEVPTTPVSEGVPRFVDWYREYYSTA